MRVTPKGKAFASFTEISGVPLDRLFPNIGECVAYVLLPVDEGESSHPQLYWLDRDGNITASQSRMSAATADEACRLCNEEIPNALTGTMWVARSAVDTILDTIAQAS